MTCSSWTQRILQSAAIFAAFFVWPALTFAEDVTLTSKQGALALTGRIIGFDGTYLTIESPYGPLTLTYAGVTCDGSTCPDADTYLPVVRISGAGRMGHVLLPALIDGFARQKGVGTTTTTSEPGRITVNIDGMARFEIHNTTSAEGFADLISFQSDLAMSLREVRPDELALAVEVGIGRLDAPGQSRIIGLDALVPVTSPLNRQSDISLAGLSRAFSGAATNWSDLGGNDAPISLHLGPHADGEVQFFLDSVVRRAGREPSDTITYHATLSDMAAAVAADPGGLGIARHGRPTVARVMSLRGRCGVVAQPTTTAIKALDYPLTTPLFLYLPEWRLHPVVHEFLAFARSDQAHLIVRRSGFIDLGAEIVPLDMQGQRFARAIDQAGSEVLLGDLQQMVRTMSSLVRTSVSFRFEAGSARLDANSRSQLLQLAQAIRDGRYDGRQLMLLGFSDGQGAAVDNLALSRTRADAVLQELSDLLGGLPDEISVSTDAFGEALPMACDDTIWGRGLNRRVELWIGSE